MQGVDATQFEMSKKPKPEAIWMIWSDELGALFLTAREKKRDCTKQLHDFGFTSARQAKRNGYRVIKTTLTPETK